MTLQYIVIAVIAVIVGWVIGFLDSNLRTTQKIKAAEQKAQIKLDEAEKKIAQADQKISLESRMAPALQQDDPGLLRLKKINNRVTVEMDGILLPEILSADKKKRLIELISIFRPWLEGGQTQQAVPFNTPPIPDSVKESAPPPAQPLVKKTEEKNISTLSIVGQIDSVLQTKLMKTKFAKAGIRLQESLQGGVQVYVGLQKYATIDDVPDEQIKSEIRAAIAEWEQKYTPGL
ncbi:hypothetical protein [Candidatus Villigracilis saccharophilus]|uniref:hypothetical protein n=1 Tax=Candidatus Villigracilis saccharophilus TaxID=3140684 RepID=UPI003134B076|nr:hypothetical protein [Anaerolineales bacterium]